ncbi:hypothetical protein [Iodobacter fluviatilis]|uniref:Uncharacterized protein n=1 Tax=Iodobacter fluviatilis TaxID=537 RepID=A0A7G3GBK6_9NEIS|nr:hypothetical protein [Iodobacter fluviatilis]QBC44681.1 hypothetical protein C1H71_14850 [Iodobacter fluviatilis]
MKNLLMISASLILAAANSALAHDRPHDDEGAATEIHLLSNVRYLSAESAWPSALPVLAASQEDLRGMRYGGSGLAWQQRWLQDLSSHVVLAYDDHEQGMAVDHAAFFYHAGATQWTLGRQSPLLASGGLSAWALPELWLNTVLGDDHWHEDGLALRYATGAVTGHAGVFRGAGLPGTESALWSTGLEWQDGPWHISGHAAYVAEVKRSLASDAHTGHSHAGQVTGCAQLIDCFAGDTLLMRANARWQGDQFWLHGAASWQKQDGQLESTLAKVNYQGELTGFALEGGVSINTELSLALRHEQMAIHHQLSGVNAAQIASKNGIANSDEWPRQTGVRLAWQAHTAHLLALELYQTHINGESNRMAMLQWQMNDRLY